MKEQETRVMLRISQDLKDRAMAAAKQQKMTFSAFVRSALEAAMEKGYTSIQEQIDELRRRVEALEKQR